MALDIRVQQLGSPVVMDAAVALDEDIAGRKLLAQFVFGQVVGVVAIIGG